MSFFEDLINSTVNKYHNFVNDVVGAGLSALGNATNFIQGALAPTFLNTIKSNFFGFINSTIEQVTNYDPRFLQNNTPIVVPHNQDLSKTPTVSEFLQSAVSVYGFKAIPDGAKPFLYNNQQLGITDFATGLSAKVWVTAEKQVIIAYQGTLGGITGIANIPTDITQVLQDVGIAAQTVTPGEKNALKFAQFVVGEAQKQGYSTNDIFVTGHSLGAIEAQYVAQQSGLGGIGFDATGIPLSKDGHGDGSNFVNVLTYGDPVSSFASDVQGEQPFAPAYDSTGGILPHYGQKVFVGSVDDQKWLNSVSQNQWGAGTILGKIGAASSYLLKGFPDFHMPWHAANNLGVNLGIKTFAILNGQSVELPIPSTFALLANVRSEGVHGVILNVGDNSIKELLVSNSQRSDYASSSLPVV